METNHRSLGEKANEVIETVPHLTIATVTINGRPWNTPVYAVHDSDYNFYWYSDLRSQHSENIGSEKEVFVVIYDSVPEDEDTIGVYMRGKAYRLEEKDMAEMGIILDLYCKKAKIAKLETDSFLGGSHTRFFKFVPDVVWANSGKREDSRWLDTRIEITKELLK